MISHKITSIAKKTKIINEMSTISHDSRSEFCAKKVQKNVGYVLSHLKLHLMYLINNLPYYFPSNPPSSNKYNNYLKLLSLRITTGLEKIEDR